MGLLLIGYIAILGVMAYYDWKKRAVSDFLIGFLWIWTFIIGVEYGQVNSPVIALFGLCIMVNTWVFHREGKPLMGWGDVLILPSFVVVSYISLGLVAFAVAMMGGICYPLFVAHKKNGGVPMITYFAASLVVACVLNFVLELL